MLPERYPLFLSKLITDSGTTGIIYLRRESRIRERYSRSAFVKAGADLGRANERERTRTSDVARARLKGSDSLVLVRVRSPGSLVLDPRGSAEKLHREL